VKNMAKTVSVVVTDDLDGSPAAGAVAFSFDGHSYEIDLSAANQAKLEKALQPFIAAGRRTTQGRPQPAARTTTPSGVDRAAVRAWAAEHGLQVSERGRISAEVMTKYDAAH
jgi:Lsr2